MSSKLSRRRFLVAAGATATTVLIGACAQPAAEPTKAPAAPAAPAAAQPAATTAPAPTAAPAAAAREKINYALFIMSQQDPAANADSIVQKTLEDRFNVDFNFIWIERTSAKDIYATRFAAGDIPDAFHYETTGVPLIEQGIIAEVPLPTIKQNMPKYFKAMADFSPLVYLGGNYKGKNYGIPINNPNNLIPFTEGWRQDSLDKIGFSKPPETLVEMEDALTKGVEQKLHQYGVTSRAKDAAQMMFANVFGAHGTFPLHWMEKEDKSGVEHGITNAAAKEALTTLNTWYKKNLIHPEFVTSAWKEVVNTWCQGKVMVTDVATWYRLYKGGELFDCVVDAGGKISMAYAPKGPKGDFGYHGWGYSTPPVRLGSQMTADNPKLAKLMEVFEACATDQELAYFVKYGKEGQDSTRDEFGVPQINKDVDRAKLGSSIGLLLMTTPEVFQTYQRSDYAEITKYAKAGTTPQRIMRDLGSFMNPDITKVQPDLTLLQGKWEVDFINGSQPLSKFDDFVKEWNDKGGKAVTDEANRAYQDMTTQLEAIKKAIAEA